MTLKLVRVVGMAILAALVTSTAIAGPLNLADPTPRQIRVEIDQELHDYAAIGGAYSLPIPASFTSDGTTATITVDGSAAAAFVDDYFNGAIGTVPGSFSDYVITIDVASGAVTSAHVSGILDTAWGTSRSIRRRAPTRSRDSRSSPSWASTSRSSATAARDARSCRAHRTIRRPAGRTPWASSSRRCSTRSRRSATSASSRTTCCAATCPSARRTSCRSRPSKWASTSGTGRDRTRGRGQGLDRARRRLPRLRHQHGRDGSKFLASGFENLFPLSPLFTVNASTILGDWQVGCRLLDPITGETLAQDIDTFEVLAARASPSGAFLD
jgi:hypothetical protein